MASWMMHFRVAQALLETDTFRAASRDICAAFVVGNIAPDSGMPAPDGRGYVPDKTISHFMRRFEGVPAGENPERCDPSLLVRNWLTSALERDDPMAAGFYLGYLCHLVTDNAWVRDFIYPAKVKFAHLRLTDGVETPEGVAKFYAFLKKDWYDMDFLYVQRHPDLPAYRLFLDTEDMENRYLPFFPTEAFEVKRQEIRAFYKNGAATVAQREVYISEAEAEGFVERVVAEITRDFGNLFAVCSKLTYYSRIECSFMV